MEVVRLADIYCTSSQCTRMSTNTAFLDGVTIACSESFLANYLRRHNGYENRMSRKLGGT